jgi:two-component system, NtrC family, nitrogen regulation response regulator NtrX
MSHLLIVDDDMGTLASLSRAFRLAGYEATVCDSADRAFEIAKTQRFDMILSDVVMPGKDGLSLLADLKSAGIAVPIVMISGQANVEMAVRATRLGAMDFLEKPLSTEKLLLTVENALKMTRLEEENQQLRQRIGKHEIVWKSETMQRVMSQIERVGPSTSRVYIHGETGTGKELVARALHEHSPRNKAPFVTINCAAVPPDLIESELFGHEKGSFTGANARYVGKFEHAHRGTLFLDEIGDMPLGMQAKLLRVLEEGEIERIGADGPTAVDVRVLTATHRDIEDLVRKNQFRQDLFHRIYVFPLILPSLRERMEDIPVLVEHFSRQITLQNSWKPKRFTPDAIEELKHYSWPGNIRELRNVVERLMLLADAEVDQRAVKTGLPLSSKTPPAAISAGGSLADKIEAFEREAIRTELELHGYRMSETARTLGLERSHLYKKCQHLGIDLHTRSKSATDD